VQLNISQPHSVYANKLEWMKFKEGRELDLYSGPFSCGGKSLGNQIIDFW